MTLAFQLKKYGFLILIFQNIFLFLIIIFGLFDIPIDFIFYLDLMGFLLLFLSFLLQYLDEKKLQDLIIAFSFFGWIVPRIIWQFILDTSSITSRIYNDGDATFLPTSVMDNGSWIFISSIFLLTAGIYYHRSKYNQSKLFLLYTGVNFISALLYLSQTDIGMISKVMITPFIGVIFYYLVLTEIYSKTTI